jgi:gliding motility-associated-like protein
VRELLTTPDTAICAGDFIRLTAGIGYDRYRWSAPGLTDLEGDTVRVRPAATTAYAIAAFAPGCNATGTVRVAVVPLPVANLGPDTLICEGETVTLRAAPGQARYRWTYVTGSDILHTATDSVLRAEAPGVYTVEVFNRLGCSVTDTVRLAACSDISEKYPLFIPNIITPNNDGYNDTWTVKNLDQYGNNRLVISNRWGHEVYRVNNYRNQWQGNVLANGTYFYQLWLEKGNRLYKGWIHVWR